MQGDISARGPVRLKRMKDLMKIGTRWRKVHRLKREAMQLGIIVVVLGLIYLFIYLSDDRKAPVIAFSDDPVSYVPGGDTKGLLAGVTATDNRDGDITKKIIAIPPTENISDTEVTVKYQVRDSRGNLTTVTRVRSLSKESASNIVDPDKNKPDPTQTVPDETQTPETPEETAQASTEEKTTEEVTTEAVTTEAVTTKEETTPEETTPEQTTPEETTPEATTPEETTPEQTTPEETTPEETTEAPRTATGPNGETIYEIVAVFIGPQRYIGETSVGNDILLQGVTDNGKRIDIYGWECDDVGKKFVKGKNVFDIRYQGLTCQLVIETNEEKPAPINNGIPVITLKQTEVTVKKGSYFHYRNVIDQLYDDKDSRDVLVQRIRVEGWDKFSTKKVGTYVLKVSVKDTDKHNSAVTVLTVHVVN